MFAADIHNNKAKNPEREPQRIDTAPGAKFCAWTQFHLAIAGGQPCVDSTEAGSKPTRRSLRARGRSRRRSGYAKDRTASCDDNLSFTSTASAKAQRKCDRSGSALLRHN